MPFCTRARLISECTADRRPTPDGERAVQGYHKTNMSHARRTDHVPRRDSHPGQTATQLLTIDLGLGVLGDRDE